MSENILSNNMLDTAVEWSNNYRIMKEVCESTACKILNELIDRYAIVPNDLPRGYIITRYTIPGFEIREDIQVYELILTMNPATKDATYYTLGCTGKPLPKLRDKPVLDLSVEAAEQFATDLETGWFAEVYKAMKSDIKKSTEIVSRLRDL